MATKTSQDYTSHSKYINWKNVDKQMKLLIFGYIRNEQNILKSIYKNTSFYIIAKLIIYHIMSYYYQHEYFDIIPRSV